MSAKLFASYLAYIFSKMCICFIIGQKILVPLSNMTPQNCNLNMENCQKNRLRFGDIYYGVIIYIQNASGFLGGATIVCQSHLGGWVKVHHNPLLGGMDSLHNKINRNLSKTQIIQQHVHSSHCL